MLSILSWITSMFKMFNTFIEISDKPKSDHFQFFNVITLKPVDDGHHFCQKWRSYFLLDLHNRPLSYYRRFGTMKKLDCLRYMAQGETEVNEENSDALTWQTIRWGWGDWGTFRRPYLTNHKVRLRWLRNIQTPVLDKPQGDTEVNEEHSDTSTWQTTGWYWGEWGAFRHQYLANHKVILRWLRNIQTPVLEKPQGETEVIEEHSDALTWQTTRWDWGEWRTFRHQYLTNHKVILRWMRSIQTPVLGKPQGDTEVIEEHSDTSTWKTTRWYWGDWGTFRHQYLKNHKVRLRWLRNIQTPLLDKPQGEAEVIDEHSDTSTWQTTRWYWGEWGAFRHQYLANHKVILRWLRNIQTPVLEKPQGETEVIEEHSDALTWQTTRWYWGEWRTFRHQYLTNHKVILRWMRSIQTPVLGKPQGDTEENSDTSTWQTLPSLHNFRFTFLACFHLTIPVVLLESTLVVYGLQYYNSCRTSGRETDYSSTLDSKPTPLVLKSAVGLESVNHQRHYLTTGRPKLCILTVSIKNMKLLGKKFGFLCFWTPKNINILCEALPSGVKIEPQSLLHDLDSAQQPNYR